MQSFQNTNQASAERAAPVAETAPETIRLDVRGVAVTIELETITGGGLSSFVVSHRGTTGCGKTRDAAINHFRRRYACQLMIRGRAE